jgi:hypothetical protein
VSTRLRPGLILLTATAIVGCRTVAPPRSGTPPTHEAVLVHASPESRSVAVTAPAEFPRAIELMPVTRFRVPRAASPAGPKDSLLTAAAECGFGTPDSLNSETGFGLVAPSDQGSIDLTVTWLECADDWTVMVHGGPGREVISSAVMDRLRHQLLSRGVRSSAGSIDGLWVASGGWMRGLRDDATWWHALEATCAESRWKMEQRDVLQDACELFIVSADHADLGVLEIGLEGVIQCRFTGAACGAEEDFIKRFLRNWARYPDTRPSPQLMSPGPQPTLR